MLDLDITVEQNDGFEKIVLIKYDDFKIVGTFTIKLKRNEYASGYLFTYGSIIGYLQESIAQKIRKIIYNSLIFRSNEDGYFKFSIFDKSKKEYIFRISKNNNSRCGLYNGFCFFNYENGWLGGLIQNHDAYKLMDYLDLSKNLNIF